jgi:hypothetical protein
LLFFFTLCCICNFLQMLLQSADDLIGVSLVYLVSGALFLFIWMGRMLGLCSIGCSIQSFVIASFSRQ